MELARRLGDVELVTVDSMQVYRGMDIGTAKPTPAEQAEVPHHLLDLADPGEEWSVTRWAAAARGAMAGIEARGHRALLVGGTGLYFQAVVDGLRPPAGTRRSEAELEQEADTAALHRRLTGAGPPGRLPDGAVQPPPGHAGAGGDARQRPSFFQLSARDWRTSRPPRGGWPACGCPGRSWPAGSGPGWRPWWRPDWWRRSRGCGRPGGCRARPARPSATGRCWPIWRTGCPWTTRWPRPSGGPGLSPAVSGSGGGGILGMQWYGTAENPFAVCRSYWETGRSHDDPPPAGELAVHQAARPRQRLPGVPRPGRCARARPVAPWPAGCATATPASGPTA